MISFFKHMNKRLIKEMVKGMYHLGFVLDVLNRKKNYIHHFF